MPTQSPIAIVGMACRLPGADDLDAYWRLLIEGRSSIGPMPADRLDRRLHLDPSGARMGTTYTDLAGIVEPLPHDPARCPLPSELAAACDPTHVTFCQVACEAVRLAGWDPWRMPTRRGGVYVGHTRGTVVSGQLIYGTLAAEAAELLRNCPSVQDGSLSPQALDQLIADTVAEVRSAMPQRGAAGEPHLDAHYVASLVSRALGWEGPAMAVNAACASSLIAMSMGISALQRGELDCAIVGGASHCKLDSLVLFSKAKSASATGSRPFDDGADGLVAAEGYVALVLKTVAAAERDGDPIWAVIRGVGVSSDGKGKSLWAPRKEGQVEAIRRAYPADLQPTAVQYLEAHATSTQVGDATELSALDEVFGPLRQGREKLPIGSAKGNVGHTLETAGMAGLLKAVLAMRHGVIPPAVNLQTLNTKVQWDQLGLQVARQTTLWPDAPATANLAGTAHDGQAIELSSPDQHELCKIDPLRCCAVNAFGIGGLNVHVVLQSRPPEVSAAVPRQTSPAASSVRLVNSDDSIAIVGAAALLPGALSLPDLADLIASQKSQIAPLGDDRWRADLGLDPHHRRPYHAISNQGGALQGWEYDWRRHRVPPKQIEAADPLQFMLLDCVEAAIHDAGLLAAKTTAETSAATPNSINQGPAAWDRQRAAVIIGTDFLGDFSANLQLAVRLPHLLDTLGELLTRRGLAAPLRERLLGEFEQAFVTKNPALLDETGSFTTSTLASRITKTFDLMGGAASVDAGDASAAALLNVASDWLHRERCDSIICAAGQRALGLFNYERLSLQGRLRGDDGRGFLLPGEGAGVVVLRRLSDARRDGNPIRGVIAGISVRRQEAPQQASPLAAQIGHLGGAAGMAELLAELVKNHAPQHAGPRQTGTRQISVYGGGNQCYQIHLAAESESEVAVPTPNASSQPKSSSQPTADSRPTINLQSGSTASPLVVRLSGENWTALAERCRQLAISIETAWDSLRTSQFAATDDVRMIMAVASAEEAAKQLQVAAARVETPPARAQLAARGILCQRVSFDRPRVAWMFSGQGSQYGGMLADLLEHDASAQATVAAIDTVFRSLGLPTWTSISGEQSDQLGSDVLHTMMAVLGADWILADQLTRRGLTPAIVGGHSFGEYAALAQAGVWSWEAAVRAGQARARAVVNHCRAGGAMLCTDADAQTVESLCRTIRERKQGGVYLANHNAPRQSVIGGETAALHAVSQLLESEGFRVMPIPVPRPYHTPLMQSTRAPLSADLAPLQMRPSLLPVLSSVTNRYEADPQAFRENLSQQMVTPVRYVDLIGRLREDGVNLIIEVGPGQVLTKLHRQILGSEGPLVVATDDRREGCRAALMLATAAYELLQPASSQNQPPSIHVPTRQTETRQSETPQAEKQQAGSAEQAHGNAVEFSADAVTHLDIVELVGSPREMGYQHGLRNAELLRKTAESIADAVEWPGGSLHCLSELADTPEQLFGDDDLEELAGIAAGSGIDLRSVIACNLFAYPDLSGLGGCSHLVVPDAAGQPLHGANEDLPLSLIIEPFRRRTVQWRRPSCGIAHITFSAAGQLGGIVGMNVAGLSVSSAMLLDRPRRNDAPIGLLHGVLVRQILRDCDSVSAALELLTSDRLRPRGSGGWALMLADDRAAQATLVEYDGEEMEIRQASELYATNHCQLLPPLETTPSHSQRRNERLGSLLRNSTPSEEPMQQALSALRDRFDSRLGRSVTHLTMNTVCRLDNQLSVVMRPASGELWVHAPGKITQDGYVRLAIRSSANTSAISSSAASSPITSESRPASQQPETPSADAAQTWLTLTQYSQIIANYQPPAGRVCDRFVVRPVTTTVERAENQQPLSGTGLVVGALESATQLAQSLAADTQLAWQPVGLDELLTKLASQPNAGPLRVVFDLVEPTNSERLTQLFEVVRQLLELRQQAGLIEQTDLIAISRLGGDFGLSIAAQPVSHPDHQGSQQGAIDCLAGLWKALAMEARAEGAAAPRYIALDVDRQLSPAALSRHLVELWGQSTDNAATQIEWCFSSNGSAGQTRIIPQPLATSANSSSASSPANIANGRAIDPAGCWVLTGGGRGVTALAAERLGKQFGVAVHLLGSTQLDISADWLDLDQAGLEQLKRETIQAAARSGVRPPISAWKRIESMLEVAHNVRRLRAAGVDVHYHACDLRDAQSVAACFATIREHGRPIHGIIHGAGFERSARFTRKQLDDVQRTLAVKLGGLDALVAASEHDPIKHFVCFGSTAGRFGSVGQTDYALANDAMARRMGQLMGQHPGRRYVCLHWTAWGDVGMAMRPEVLASLQGRGIALMPATEGIDHLIEELTSGSREPEVVITDAGRFQQLVAQDRLLQSVQQITQQAVEQAAQDPPQQSARVDNSDGSRRVTGRYALRWASDTSGSSGLNDTAPSQLLRRVFLWGDSTWCAAIAAELRTRGADCCFVDCDDQLDSMRTSLDRFALDGTIDAFLAIPPDRCGDLATAPDRLLLLLQAWMGHLDRHADRELPVVFGTLTQLGGDFGFAGQFQTPASLAAMAGLVKSMVVELHHRGFTSALCHALDTEYGDPTASQVNNLLNALLRRDKVLESTLATDAASARRLVYRLAELPTPQPNHPTQPNSPAQPRGDWLVTGGGRGITCEVALGIARRFGLRLHILGSSDLNLVPANWFGLDEAGRAKIKRQVIQQNIQNPRREPPIRAWQRLLAAADVAENLQRFAAAGVAAQYYCCDLVSAENINATVAQINATGVRISGLLHGAGYEKSADVLKKTAADVRRTLAIKLDAYNSLLQALSTAPLQHMIAFGSISGRLGSLGQIDYCLANDAVAKRTYQLRNERPQLLATTFAWHSWDGVGMAVRPETRQLKEKLGMTYMSITEGVDRVIEELSHGLPDAEVLITTPAHLQRMGQQASPEQLNNEQLNNGRIGNKLIEDKSISDQPVELVTPSAEPAPSGEHRYNMPLFPDSDPFLVQHRFKDRPLMPLVMGIEGMLQAASKTLGSHSPNSQNAPTSQQPAWTLTNLEVHGPLRFPNDQPVSGQVELAARDQGWQASLQSYFRNAAGQASPKPRLHFTAQLTARQRGETCELGGAELGGADLRELTRPIAAAEIEHLRPVAIRDDLVLYHGPIFRMVQQIAIGDRAAVATIKVPPTRQVAGEQRSDQAWVSSPAVLDACLFAAGIQLFVSDEGAVSVPLGIDRLDLLRPCPVGQTLWLRVINRSLEQTQASFDFVLLDDQGTLYVRALGYRASIVAHANKAMGSQR
ncbi:C45 family autoproteolytic acyltransferase/hydolase [Planctomycetaceae bacterium SH139]